MGIAAYIKVVGRGKDGARSLDVEQAREVFGLVLDKQVTDLEIGAFLMAMRIKAESDEELEGFCQAAEQRGLRIHSERPVVLLPSYNGARKLPNLTALLAWLLAREGVPVLVHGVLNDETRVTTADIFQTMGCHHARHEQDVQRAWSRHEPAFVCIDTLCPPLARLLDVRWTIGLRGPGHTVVKLLNPITGARALRVVSYTHPEYGRGHHGFLQKIGADAMLMRGTEGEPVADPRRQPKIETFIAGQPRAELSLVREDGSLSELPLLPKEIDANTTALYIQSVVSGEKPAPEPVLKQVEAVVQALGMMRAP
ncbi:MAG: DNA-binding protein YbiB [Aquabacterium sp.]|nr:MAG: DNA-binding protein YbiB [Aquabacterium sp.]